MTPEEIAHLQQYWATANEERQRALEESPEGTLIGLVGFDPRIGLRLISHLKTVERERDALKRQLASIKPWWWTTP